MISRHASTPLPVSLMLGLMILGGLCFVLYKYHWVQAATLAAPLDIVSDITTTSGRSYLFDECGVNDRYYIDRDYVFTSFTTPLYNGRPCIKTANGDSHNSDASLLSFTLNQPATIYIYFDRRMSTPPSWVSGLYVQNSKLAYTTDSDMNYFVIFSCKSNPGRIVLGGPQAGGSSGIRSMYVVAFGAESAGEKLCSTDVTVTPTDTNTPDTPTFTPTPTFITTLTPTSSPTATPTVTEMPVKITPITDTPTPTATSTPTPTTPEPVTKKKWTMLLYLAGDTGRIDGGSVFGELRKAVRRLESNPNPDVNVVALLDGPNDLDTYRETFTPQIHDTPLGEKPMDDPQTLVDFVQQAKQDFPAEHYYLVIADHANGVQGIAWDTTTAPNKTALLTPAKLEQALKQISNDGADPLDVVHFDGCSFGLFENVTMMHNYVNYLVLSENIGWSVFGYDQYRASLTATTTPREFALAVAQGYAQTVAGKALPYTISAIDTNQTGAAMTALNGLADALHNYIGNDAAKRTTIDAVRSQSQKFDSARPLLEITNDDWYVDLVDFATKLKAQALDAQINTTTGVVIETLQTGATPLVIYEAHLTASIDQNSTENYVGDHVWQLDNAHGLSIYYPPRGGGGEFTRYINGDTFTYFNDQSRWDEFLQGGIPPLLPGDSPPDDVIIPLSPCSATEQQSTIQHRIYLPVIKR
ncbi:MAG: clostripain-related cysteine peptidase [Chloroflexi bacterium]|nr:clostripain-related cysteine peptidase [Chloroflexota bacterium]